MKKLKMIVTSVIVLAIVGSAFAFNAKKTGSFCTSGGTSTTCIQKSFCGFRRVIGGIPNTYYVVDWDGGTCNQTCIVSAQFILD